VDLQVLQPLGKFDASYFLPVIARLSSTYLEVQKDKKDQAHFFFHHSGRLTVCQLGLIALGVSALGKKRHRVDVARRLIVGSLVASFEQQKEILYCPEQPERNVLFTILDSSLPWWAERDSWGRWTSTSARNSMTISGLGSHDPTLLFASVNTSVHESSLPSILTLSEAITRLHSHDKNDGSQSRSRLTAMYSSNYFYVLNIRPGHVLHNSRNLKSGTKELTPAELMRMARESAGETSPSQIFSSQYFVFQ
jgi:hypothetical protein